MVEVVGSGRATAHHRDKERVMTVDGNKEVRGRRGRWAAMSLTAHGRQAVALLLMVQGGRWREAARGGKAELTAEKEGQWRRRGNGAEVVCGSWSVVEKHKWLGGRGAAMVLPSWSWQRGPGMMGQ